MTRNQGCRTTESCIAYLLQSRIARQGEVTVRFGILFDVSRHREHPGWNRSRAVPSHLGAPDFRSLQDAIPRPRSVRRPVWQVRSAPRRDVPAAVLYFGGKVRVHEAPHRSSIEHCHVTTTSLNCGCVANPWACRVGRREPVPDYNHALSSMCRRPAGVFSDPAGRAESIFRLRILGPRLYLRRYFRRRSFPWPERRSGSPPGRSREGYVWSFTLHERPVIGGE